LDASITGAIAGLRAMRGDFEEARQLQAKARALHEELGQRFRIAARSLVAADIEVLAGRPDEATAILRWAYDELQEMGITSVMSTMAAFLADALASEGDDIEALRYSQLSHEHAAAEDIVTQVMWRVARAKAAREPHLAEQAVQLAARTDYPDLKARAFLAVWQVTADDESRRRAVTEYERKGNVAAVARLAAQALPS
jgi:hypothetical protein